MVVLGRGCTVAHLSIDEANSSQHRVQVRRRVIGSGQMQPLHAYLVQLLLAHYNLPSNARLVSFSPAKDVGLLTSHPSLRDTTAPMLWGVP